jgi:hypothetical protein
VNILRELAGGDRRSIGKADRVVKQIFKTPALFGDVLRGFTHADPVIRMRCADVAEKVSSVHPEWLDSHKRAILSFANTIQEKEVRWHMAQMLPRLELSSMQALFEISENDARLRARVIPILRGAVRNGSPAARSRAKKLLTAIDRGPAGLGNGRDAV